MQASAYPASATVGVGLRLVALIIDSIAFIIAYFIVAAIASGSTGGGILAACVVAIGTLVYFPVMEKLYGASLGKMALSIKVVKEDGSPLQWGDVIVRYLLRIVDGLFAGLVGAILIWSSPMRQRLGDRAARTLVVRKDALPGAPVAAQQF